MSAIDLDKLDELHAKATKEPWIESGRGIDGGEYQGDTVIGLEERGGPWQSYQVLDVSADNRALIVALRNVYPALRAELSRLREIETAALRLQTRLDAHFGNTDPSDWRNYDWKEQAELRAALTSTARKAVKP